jgi:hypothetical protein
MRMKRRLYHLSCEDEKPLQFLKKLELVQQDVLAYVSRINI